jgi:SPP1 gp7 family putative phage head morphogenesis protein
VTLLILQANPPADPNRFDEAIDWHRKRTGITKDEYNALSEAARQRAFTIAGVTQASLIREIQDSLTQALENGQSLDDWKAVALPKLTKAWAGSVENPSVRADTIFRTNVQHAYSAGRHAQLTDPVTRKIRPYWLYDSVIDGRTTAGCRSRNGVLLHQDDPWWNNNYPPTHFNCRAIARSLRRSEAEARGITEEPPPGIVAPGFGGLPGADNPETDPLAAQVQRNADAGLVPPALPPAPVVTVTPTFDVQAAEQRGAYVAPDVPAAARDIFGARVPTPQSLEAAYSAGGAHARLAGVSVQGANKVRPLGVRIELGLMKDGQDIGALSRLFYRRGGQLVAYQESIELLDTEQGAGVGSAIHEATLAAYRQMGVSQIELDAEFIGRYVWAKKGFQWSAADVVKKRAELFEYLTRTVGLTSAESSDIAERLSGNPAAVASLVIKGKQVGKAFLLQASPWSGTLPIAP